MKSLFDRALVYQYLDTADTAPDTEHADGIIVHAAERASGDLALVWAKTDAAASDLTCSGSCETCTSACHDKKEEAEAESAPTANAVPANPTDLTDFLRAQKDNTLTILLMLDTPLSDSAQKDLLTTAKRTDMTARLLLVSPYHKTLDALQKAEPRLRISPLCANELVRPWIYAAYMGAAALCMDARDVLLDADRYGCPLVDRAHNNGVTVFSWNAEDEDTIKALVTVGCDAIMTHTPALARALVW